MRNLNIAICQLDIVWEDKIANLSKIDNYISALPKGTDVLILPEMFSTGFSMDPNGLAEDLDGHTIEWMKNRAKLNDIVLCGSIIFKNKDHYYNRFVWVQPDGVFRYYDKRHLFAMGGEGKWYTAGKQRILIEYKSWKICPMICYDLRFPAWSRNDIDYDLLIYVANWPIPRIQHWNVLLTARAIENQSYVVGVNRYGTQPSGWRFNGHSKIIDPMGNLMVEIVDKEAVEIRQLEKEKVTETRELLPFLQDYDHIETH